MTLSTTMAVASPISTYGVLCSSSSSKPVINSLSSSKISHPQDPTFIHYRGASFLGVSVFSQWNGLRHLGLSVSQKTLNFGLGVGRKKKKGHGMVVRASLFGVGAPEALVIGVVALLVFGPKGLAEVARNLGKTLRAFQPTIRELQEVSREFKSTLEKEIGLDGMPSSSQNMYNSNKADTNTTPLSTTTPKDSQTIVNPSDVVSPNQAYSAEDYLKVTEQQLKGSASQQQEKAPNGKESQPASQNEPQVISKETAAGTVPPLVKPEDET